MEQHELGQLVFRCRMHLHYPLPVPHCSTERLLYEKRGTVMDLVFGWLVLILATMSRAGHPMIPPECLRLKRFESLLWGTTPRPVE